MERLETAGAEANPPPPAVSDRWPFLSVIVPVKNAGGHLSEQLSALVRQRYGGEWELIVVDNGSSDGSLEVARRFARTHSNVKIVEAVDGAGCAYVRNHGAEVARGEAFLFCDADDVVGDRWLEEMGAALRRHDLVAGGIDTEHLNRDATWRRAAFTGSSNVALLFKPIVIGCNIGVSRRAFERVGGFDAYMAACEDVDFSWRLQLNGYAITDVPGALVHYRYRRDHAPAIRQTVSYAIAHVRLFRRYRSQGMPRWPLTWAIAEYQWLLANIGCWFRRGDVGRRQEWLQRGAERLGRLVGSFQFLTFYP